MTLTIDRPEPGTAADGTRLHALDALRGFALLCGVALHAAMPYLAGFNRWPLVDGSRSVPLGLMFFVVHTFRMTVFFVIAGFFARLLLERRGVGAFLRNRTLRIVVPLVVCSTVVFPMIIAALRRGMVGQLPRGVAGGADDHLWFLYMLLLLYAAALPVRELVRSRIDTGGRLRASIDVGLRAAVRGPWAAFVLSVPLAIAFISSTWLLWDGIPTPHRPLVPNLPAAVAFSVAFLVGWLLHRQVALLTSIERQWPIQLGLAGALTVACLWIVGVTRSPETAAADLRSVIYGALYAAAGWAWTLALIGVALRFFATESPPRRYVSDASYTIYLAHYPILIMLQAPMQGLPLHWAVKFPAQLVVALALLFATYHWLVRFTFVGEVLHGPRARRTRAQETPVQPARWPARTRRLLSRMRP